MVSESPNPTSAPTQEPIVTDSPTVTPTFAPVVSPTAEPIVSPYPEKFGEPEIVVNKAEQTVDVTVTRVDASCEDSAVLVGIYNSNGILVGFRKITPVFDENGTFKPGSHGAYPRAMKEAAKEAGVPVVDLTTVTEQYLAQVGELWSRPLFVWPKDNTHLKYEGAVMMAGFLAEGLRALGEPYSSLLAEEKEEQ